jgi:DNA sulfur modification protein DndC
MKFDQKIHEAQVIFWSHSGGKDSQAGLAFLVRHGFKGKLVIIHSDLGDMEWETMHTWIEAISYGIEVHVVRAEVDFFGMARSMGRLPSGHQQYCTDILKTEPIKAFIHAYMYQYGYTLAINATGMRAAESKKRALKKPFTLSKGDGTSGMHMPKKFPEHTIYDWMPIFYYSTEEVFEEIALAGQKPHPLYAQGFSRLSCVFCVNGKIEEHKKAAELRPELAAKFAKLERDIGKTLRLKQIKGKKYPKYLDEYANIKQAV